MRRHAACGAVLVAALVLAGSSAAGSSRAPHNRSLPKVSGQTLAGKTLSAGRGRWSNRPTTFRYAWQSCNAAGRACRIVSGAKRNRFMLRARDVGHRMRVVVVAVNRAGRGSARSKATAQVTTANNAGPPPPPPPGASASASVLLRAPRLWQQASERLRPAGPPARREPRGHRVLVHPGLRDLRRAERRRVDRGYRVVALERRPHRPQRGLHPRHQRSRPGVRGRELHERDRRVRDRLHAHNLYAEVSLMWAAAGSQQADDHPPILDQDHSPAAWTAIANAFKAGSEHDLRPAVRAPRHQLGLLEERRRLLLRRLRSLWHAVRVEHDPRHRSDQRRHRLGDRLGEQPPGWLANKPADPLNQLMAEAACLRRQHLLHAFLLDREHRTGRSRRAGHLRRVRRDLRRLELRIVEHRPRPSTGPTPTA